MPDAEGGDAPGHEGEGLTAGENVVEMGAEAGFVDDVVEDFAGVVDVVHEPVFAFAFQPYLFGGYEAHFVFAGGDCWG